MKKSKITSNPKVEEVFKNYPKPIFKKLSNLRKLIIKVAEEIDEIETLEETLKWGEPSYISKQGSTIRINWKKKSSPNEYAIYFQCTTQLVPTFRIVYKDAFKFEGNRALVFNLEEDLPLEELKNCIKSGLLYHKVKKLPLLGL